MHLGAPLHGGGGSTEPPSWTPFWIVQRPILFWGAISLLSVLYAIAGVYTVHALGHYGERLERRVLAQMASAAAAALPVDAIAKLNGTPSDVGTPAMREAQQALLRLQKAVPQSRYAYLMAMRDHDVIYLVDNEAPDVLDFVEPGTIYEEATPELRSVFRTGRAVVEGPVQDQWGNWVSGLAPVSAGGKVIALLGVDIDADRWRDTINRYRLFGLLLVLALACIISLFGVIVIVQGRLGARLADAYRIVENSSTIVYRMKVAPGLPITYLSNNVARFGLKPDEVVGSPNVWQTFLHPDDLAEVDAETERVLSGVVETATWERQLRDADGTYKWWRGRVRCIRNRSGAPVALEGLLDEIDDRKSAERQLLFSNTLLTTQMETSPDGILVVDELAHIVTFNQRFADMWNIRFICVGGDDSGVLAAVTAAVTDEVKFLARVRYLYEHPREASHDELRTKDGRFIERHSAGLHTGDGRYLGRVWFFRDITARRVAEEEVRHSARHDRLTGLANRTVFAEAVEKAIASAQRGGKTFAVLFLDLDHFKDVNDTLGHPVGDELLRAVADRLRSNVRETDTVARFGGDEFAIIAADIDEPSDAAVLGDALIGVLTGPYLLGGNDVRCGASIGIAFYDLEEPDAETLMSHADLALYLAKAEGRGRYRFFTDAMDADVHARVTLSSELRTAIDSDQLFLVYQPKVDLKTKRITGAEALVRWRHPGRGTLAPEDFLPSAETSGVVFLLDRWVLQQACRQVRAWLDAGLAIARLTVNVCAMQGKKPADFERDVSAAVLEHRLPPGALEIELPEVMLRDPSPQLRATLMALRDRGLRLAVNDYGTGISSLDHVRRLPIDRVNFPPCVVSQLTIDSAAAAVARADIGLARELGIITAANGIEKQDQVDRLVAWGCVEGQGFLFAKPLSSDEVAQFFRSGIVL
jgi:diguanylate cyclase (GGDEF)-like protein/PAS domain S-box-containing protein